MSRNKDDSDEDELNSNEAQQQQTSESFCKEVLQDRVVLSRVLIPSFLYTLERELVLPILPLFVEDFTQSGDEIGWLISCYGIGLIIGNLPAGASVSFNGWKTSMIFALFVEITATLVFFFATNLYILMIARIISGLSFSFFNVSRQVFISKNVTKNLRGRLSSLLGGLRRGLIASAPVMSGLILQYLELKYVLFVQIALGFINLAWCLIVFRNHRRDKGSVKELSTQRAQKRGTRFAGYTQVFIQYWVVLLKTGLFCFIITVIRTSRAFLFPYQGVRMGLSDSIIGFVIGSGNLVDFAMVPVGGYVIDTYGRRLAAFLFSIGGFFTFISFAVLSTVYEDLGDSSVPFFFAVSALMGLSNGMSAGLVMSMCQDIAQSAEEDKRGQVVAIYQILTDSGSIVGPITIGSLSTISLNTTLMFLTVLSFVGIIWASFVLPETRELPSSHEGYIRVDTKDKVKNDQVELVHS